ncbi:MAG: hypothetical protein KBD01_01140 [Acidobacteria bacterium]|nr:hypothetical protein [Acidobacteriota bacterium]
MTELPQTVALALRVVGVLERLGIPYHVGGSFASAIHGVPRQTRDLDVVVDLHQQQVDALVGALGSEFFADPDSIRAALARGRSANVIHLDSGLKVDLFPKGGSEYDGVEFARAQSVPVAAGGSPSIRVKSPEDTVLRKLEWFRAGGDVSDRQWHDVLGVLKTQSGRLDVAYLRRWARNLGVSDLLERALALA